MEKLGRKFKGQSEVKQKKTVKYKETTKEKGKKPKKN